MDSAPRAVPPSLNGWNPEYLDAEYQRYLADPSSVGSDLRAFFQGLELGMQRSGDVVPPSSASPQRAGASGGADAHFQYAIDHLIVAYREVGHVQTSCTYKG